MLSVKRFLTKSFLNVLDSATQITTLIGLIFWLKIISNDVRKNFDVSENMNKADKLIFFQIEMMANHFKSYIEIQSFAIFFIVVQTIKFFYFSPQIARMLDVLKAAKIDIINFIVIFSIILIAFATLGFFTFGVNSQDFENFNSSLISCLIMLMGNINLEVLLKYDSKMGTFFFFFFMVFFF